MDSHEGKVFISSDASMKMHSEEFSANTWDFVFESTMEMPGIDSGPWLLSI
jgi:hypothetical protein